MTLNTPLLTGIYHAYAIIHHSQRTKFDTDITRVPKYNQKAPEWADGHRRQRTRLVRPTCNPNHKLLASVSAEIKSSGFWWYQHFMNLEVMWLPTGREIQKSGSEKLSHTIVIINHQFWAPRQNGAHRRRKVQLWELQKVSHLDLGSGQGYISMHNTHRTTSMSDHVTVGSSSAEIWPFEICVIWTFREVWTRVIALLVGNSKIGLWQPVE